MLGFLLKQIAVSCLNFGRFDRNEQTCQPVLFHVQTWDVLIEMNKPANLYEF